MCSAPATDVLHLIREPGVGDEVADRGLEARGGEVRRMEIDEQRAEIADAVAQVVDAG